MEIMKKLKKLKT